MIKFKLEKTSETSISFQVLEQDISITVGGDLYGKFVFDKKYSIVSSSYPELFTDSVYIRGDDKGMDNNISTLNFLSKLERDIHYMIILDLFHEFSLIYKK